MLDPTTIERTASFHGHMCPGLAMGMRAAEAAVAEIGANSLEQEVVAIVESDMCGVDAIQFLTGCTFGKGNLVHRDHGKVVFTFVRQSDGRAVRIGMRLGAMGPPDPGQGALLATVRAGDASREERERFWALQRQRSERILDAPFEELYEVQEVEVEAPRRARSMTLVACARCGEPTLEPRVRRLGERDLCPPCFEREAT